MWARIENGRVAEVTDIDPEGRFHPSFLWFACDISVREGDTYKDGTYLKTLPSALTPDQIQAKMVALVQSHMDGSARQFNYDSIAIAISYADEPAVPKFQVEGRAFRAWRSLVWARFYEIMSEVDSGVRGAPNDDDLLAELPELDMPERK